MFSYDDDRPDRLQMIIPRRSHNPGLTGKINDAVLAHFPASQVGIIELAEALLGVLDAYVGRAPPNVRAKIMHGLTVRIRERWGVDGSTPAAPPSAGNRQTRRRQQRSTRH